MVALRSDLSWFTFHSMSMRCAVWGSKTILFSLKGCCPAALHHDVSTHNKQEQPCTCRAFQAWSVFLRACTGWLLLTLLQRLQSESMSGSCTPDMLLCPQVIPACTSGYNHLFLASAVVQIMCVWCTSPDIKLIVATLHMLTVLYAPYAHAAHLFSHDCVRAYKHKPCAWR